MFDTNFLFLPSTMTILLDGGAGSSGKGKLASFIGAHADNWQFCCNAFMTNAAHWVVTDDGNKYLYQALNSVAHLYDKYEKMYICGGAVHELGPLTHEIKTHGLTPDKLGIHPMVAIVQDKDIGYECGSCDFEGNPYENRTHSDCMKLGSTLHGVGAARARRILRRSDVKLARDCEELRPYLCWTDSEMMDRLNEGQAGLMEIAQGYQLGYLTEYYPKCTSRNCTVAAGLDDCGLPPSVANNVVINFRTFPIRVNSNKYVHADTEAILTADDMDLMRASGEADKIKVLEGDSGGCYPDQKEITWEEVTETSGIREIDPDQEIRERTSLTKLERRVYTFSTINLHKAIKFNECLGDTYISVNFANYVDANLEGNRACLKSIEAVSPKLNQWIKDNIKLDNQHAELKYAELKFLGTGAKTDDMIMMI